MLKGIITLNRNIWHTKHIKNFNNHETICYVKFDYKTSKIANKIIEIQTMVK